MGSIVLIEITDAVMCILDIFAQTFFQAAYKFDVVD